MPNDCSGGREYVGTDSPPPVVVDQAV